ncbi:hypothetical protein PFISCL1PPCAC_25998, partial [Pristionchus fissidentatus]
AFNFSKNDILGNVISRSFQLMQTGMKNDASFENLEYLVNSMKMERKLTLEHDESASPMRDLVYSFSTGLEISIQSIIEYRKHTYMLEEQKSAQEIEIPSNTEGMDQENDDDCDEDVSDNDVSEK